MADNLHVEIVAPGERVFRGEAQSVRAPGVDGSFQVLPRHAPIIAALEVGALIVTTASGERIAYATTGGFLEVLNNRVTILAEAIEPESDMDMDRARQAEGRAERRGESPEDGTDGAQTDDALDRARDRVRSAMGQVGSRS